jgi:hypothetical protein
VGQTEVTHAEPTWVPTWSDFRAQARHCAERAAAELEECWRDQCAISDSEFFRLGVLAGWSQAQAARAR